MVIKFIYRSDLITLKGRNIKYAEDMRRRVVSIQKIMSIIEKMDLPDKDLQVRASQTNAFVFSHHYQ
jgi:hypothetical protein